MSAFEFLVALVVLSAALSLVMTVAWIIHQWTGNSGWIDTTWTFGLGLIGVVAALWPAPGEATARAVLVAALAAVWALRLGVHIAHRSSGVGDDPRYADLVKEWDADAPRQMFILLQKQAIVSIPLAMTLYLASHNAAAPWRGVDLVAVALFAAGIAGEALADHQLKQFRATHAHRTDVCDVGLWGWSRHPNYFFEWLMWVALALLAIGSSPWGWLAIGGPVAIYWLLTQVSGIPPLEEHMLRTRGEAFRRYQARTSAFFPLPPRSV